MGLTGGLPVGRMYTNSTMELCYQSLPKGNVAAMQRPEDLALNASAVWKEC